MVVIPYKFKNKDELRKWLWKYLSDYHLTMVPRPCFARIPSFRSVEVATQRLTAQEPWKAAQAVLVGPDDVTQEARAEAIRAGKRLYVPVPGEERVLRLEGVDRRNATVAALMKEIARFGTVVPLDEARDAAVIVTGALSVDRLGHWLGQGSVFGELPLALTRAEGPFAGMCRIALVDDMQIFEDFSYLVEPGEARIDLIVTSTQAFTPGAAGAPGAHAGLAAPGP